MIELAVHRRIKILLCAVTLITPPLAAGAFDLGALFGGGADSGTGKFAQLAFRLRDGFVPTSVAWSPDGKYIASAGTHSRSLHVWDVGQRKVVQDIELPTTAGVYFHDIAWSPDGQHFALCLGYAIQLRVYNAHTWKVERDFDQSDVPACQKPAFSSDSTQLTVVGVDLATFSTEDWSVIRHLRGGRRGAWWHRGDSLWGMAYLTGSHTLVFSGGAYEHDPGGPGSCGTALDIFAARLWTLKSDETTIKNSFVVECSSVGGSNLIDIAAHPDGRRIAVTSVANQVENITYLIDATPPVTIVGRVSTGPTQVTDVAFTPDGRYLFVGQNAGPRPSPVEIVDASSLRVLDTLHGPDRINALAVHPASTGVVAASGDGLTVWTLSPR